MLKWDAYSRWLFGPNSAWGRIETTIIGKAHPTLFWPTILKSESNQKKGPFQLKTEQTVWDLPIRILPTLPSLAESGIAEGQITKNI